MYEKLHRHTPFHVTRGMVNPEAGCYVIAAIVAISSRRDFLPTLRANALQLLSFATEDLPLAMSRGWTNRFASVSLAAERSNLKPDKYLVGVWPRPLVTSIIAFNFVGWH